MSLADRIRTAQIDPNSPNKGCQTCLWLTTVDAETEQLIKDWIAAGHSTMQLHEILSTPGEDISDNLLPISYTAFKHHTRHHGGKRGE